MRSIVFAFLLAGLLKAVPNAPPFALTDDASPRTYDVELTIDPDRDSFQGNIHIETDLRRRTQVIWLNATALKISTATVQTAGRTLAARATLVDGEFLAIETDVAVGPGRVVVSIRYEAPFTEKARIGPYRLKFENKWYAFTTFTPNGARSAFPCFDQPRFKARWEFRIRFPRDQRAFANARLLSETDEGGMKVAQFSATEPLASEVVAFAVGPLDLLEGNRVGAGQTSIRILTPRGHAAEGEEAALAAAEMIPKLEDFTGIPYPYGKLDLVAVPELPFGAVENPGLITFGSRTLLVAPGKVTETQRIALRRIVSHELAHQWFGDLVTQEGWEDVWLSEGFATWLSAKVMDQNVPAARRNLAGIVAREKIMATDASAKARAVRIVMNDSAALKDVYNRLVYQKAAAVLMMLEGWLGEETLQAALRLYLSGHRYGTATTGDFTAALRVTAQTEPAAVLHDFLDQSGIPTIRAEAHCEPGTSPRIVFEQTNTANHWTVPVCWKTEHDSTCTLVEGRAQADLTHSTACPSWVFTNANGSGYYRTEWTAAQLEALAENGLRRLNAAERLTLVNDVINARSTGKLNIAAAEPLLKRLASDSEPDVAEAAAKTAGEQK